MITRKTIECRDHKKLLLWFALILLLTALLLCWFAGRWHDRKHMQSENILPLTDADGQISLLELTHIDKKTEDEHAIEVDLTGTENEYVITEGGSYRIKGTMAGTIRIAADKEVVHLILSNVQITSKTGPAIWSEAKGKVILTLEEGSENTVSDSGYYPPEVDAEGCIYVNGDLTINGTGTMAVNGLNKDAIHSREIVKVVDGKINIKCKRNGIYGADGINVCGGNIGISSEKIGMKATAAGEAGRGDLVISGGEHQIIAGRYAFQTGRGDIWIYSCRILDESIISTCDAGGEIQIQEGCMQ